MGRPVVHFEIGCKDRNEIEKFYKKLFKWDVEAFEGSGMIDTGTDDGIQGHFSSLDHEPRNYVTVYVDVDDINASIKKAEDLGGKAVVGPVEMPDAGTFAWIADPEGNTIGLWQGLETGE